MSRKKRRMSCPRSRPTSACSCTGPRPFAAARVRQDAVKLARETQGMAMMMAMMAMMMMAMMLTRRRKARRAPMSRKAVTTSARTVGEDLRCGSTAAMKATGTHIPPAMGGTAGRMATGKSKRAGVGWAERARATGRSPRLTSASSTQRLSMCLIWPRSGYAKRSVKQSALRAARRRDLGATSARTAQAAARAALSAAVRTVVRVGANAAAHNARRRGSDRCWSRTMKKKRLWKQTRRNVARGRGGMLGPSALLTAMMIDGGETTFL
mmetsp:Transcript_7045/g.15361  ORF Transcript_7045/g.15361 Transcript_7045/m.15361 type:complete len:267 (+) Transcript_7045:243-1043(+)